MLTEKHAISDNTLSTRVGLGDLAVKVANRSSHDLLIAVPVNRHAFAAGMLASCSSVLSSWLTLLVYTCRRHPLDYVHIRHTSRAVLVCLLHLHCILLCFSLILYSSSQISLPGRPEHTKT